MPQKPKTVKTQDPYAVELVRNALLDAISGASNLDDGHRTLEHIEDAQPEERGQNEIDVRFGAIAPNHLLSGRRFRIRVEEITDSVDRPVT